MSIRWDNKNRSYTSHLSAQRADCPYWYAIAFVGVPAHVGRVEESTKWQQTLSLIIVTVLAMVFPNCVKGILLLRSPDCS